MDFYESDLEDIIWNNIQYYDSRDELRKKGLSPLHEPIRFYRQFRIGNYGIADIVTVSKEYDDLMSSSFLLINVYELKRGDITQETLFQLCRYMKGVKDYFRIRKPKMDVRIFGTIIGKSFNNKGDWVFALHNFRSIDIYEYRYSINGIELIYVPLDYVYKNNGFKK